MAKPADSLLITKAPEATQNMVLNAQPILDRMRVLDNGDWGWCRGVTLFSSLPTARQTTPAMFAST